MRIYHFDYRDNGSLVRDKLGTEIDSFEEARIAAVSVLVELAHDRMQAPEPHQLSIEVRDERQPVLLVVLTLEVRQLA